MDIEKEIFKKTKINYEKLIKYGFEKQKDSYILKKQFLNNQFLAIISITKKGYISGKVYEIDIQEEYTNIKTKAIEGSFVNKVKEEYKNILIDIKNGCCEEEYFISNQANRITKYIEEKYKDKPEFLWDNAPGFGVFRNKQTKKWYAIIMNINKSKIDKENKEIEIINLKLKTDKIEKLTSKEGYYKAYHMNKKYWISILLDNTIDYKEITKLIDESYEIVNSKY